MFDFYYNFVVKVQICRVTQVDNNNKMHKRKTVEGINDLKLAIVEDASLEGKGILKSFWRDWIFKV